MKEIKINIALYEDSQAVKPDKKFSGAFFYNDLLPQKYLSENLDTCWERVKQRILQELYGEE